MVFVYAISMLEHPCTGCISKEMEILHLKSELAHAREHARNWEHIAKDTRAEIQRLRMECDTERITRDLEPHDLPRESQK